MKAVTAEGQGAPEDRQGGEGSREREGQKRRELEAAWYQISPLLGEPLSQAGSVKLQTSLLQAEATFSSAHTHVVSLSATPPDYQCLVWFCG